MEEKARELNKEEIEEVTGGALAALAGKPEGLKDSRVLSDGLAKGLAEGLASGLAGALANGLAEGRATGLANGIAAEKEPVDLADKRPY